MTTIRAFMMRASEITDGDVAKALDFVRICFPEREVSPESISVLQEENRYLFYATLALGPEDQGYQGNSFPLVAIVAAHKRDDGSFFLHHMCVHPDMRGQGIGEILLRTALTAISQSYKPTYVTLDVEDCTGVAARLYKRVGFRPVYLEGKPTTSLILLPA